MHSTTTIAMFLGERFGKLEGIGFIRLCKSSCDDLRGKSKSEEPEAWGKSREHQGTGSQCPRLILVKLKTIEFIKIIIKSKFLWQELKSCVDLFSLPISNEDSINRSFRSCRSRKLFASLSPVFGSNIGQNFLSFLCFKQKKIRLKFSLKKKAKKIYSLTCELEISIGWLRTNQINPSVQGGVVNEPRYR